jgi:flagellar motor switch protein FliM
VTASDTLGAAPLAASGGRKRRKSGPQPFDFRRPSKFSRDHARALQIVHETFARQFTTILSTTLRSVSSVTVASVDHISYDEYVRSSPELCFLAILNIDPLSGAAILQLPLDIGMAAIDRLLGGTGDGAQPRRALTDIESSLLRELVQRVLRELDYAFESLVKTSTSIVQLESNPQFAQVAAASTWWSRRRTTSGSARGSPPRRCASRSARCSRSSRTSPATRTSPTARATTRSRRPAPSPPG